MELSFSEFVKFRDLIYNRTGLHFEEKKIYLVKKRIGKRMQALGISKAIDYLRFLLYTDTEEHNEFHRLINLLTTNETYFFREFEQLQAFAEHCLPEVCSAKERLHQYDLTLWSAGCSTGEEPYTLAIILREMLEKPAVWNMEIVGTDIDTEVLKKAKLGIYQERSLKDVPVKYFDKYFVQKNGGYHISLQARRHVSFRATNLYNELEMDCMRQCDFIFCRNVLIYFDDESRRKIVSKFHEKLNPGGYIFLGHSESLNRISSAFAIRRKGGFIVYQKAGG